MVILNKEDDRDCYVLKEASVVYHRKQGKNGVKEKAVMVLVQEKGQVIPIKLGKISQNQLIGLMDAVEMFLDVIKKFVTTERIFYPEDGNLITKTIKTRQRTEPERR